VQQMLIVQISLVKMLVQTQQLQITPNFFGENAGYSATNVIQILVEKLVI
jgi:hypothetical protein